MKPLLQCDQSLRPPTSPCVAGAPASRGQLPQPTAAITKPDSGQLAAVFVPSWSLPKLWPILKDPQLP